MKMFKRTMAFVLMIGILLVLLGISAFAATNNPVICELNQAETISTSTLEAHSDTESGVVACRVKLGGINGCWRCKACGRAFLTNTQWQLHSLSTSWNSPCHFYLNVYWQWWN